MQRVGTTRRRKPIQVTPEPSEFAELRRLADEQARSMASVLRGLLLAHLREARGAHRGT